MGAAVAGTCGLTAAGGALLGAVLIGRVVPPTPLLGELGLEGPNPKPPPPRLRGIPLLTTGNTGLISEQMECQDQCFPQSVALFARV